MAPIFLLGLFVLHLGNTTKFPPYNASLRERKTTREQVTILGCE